MAVYLTGDTHGDFTRVAAFCEKNHTTMSDIVIILGDAGLNYYMDVRDRPNKNLAASIPATLFCIHGNHEARPQRIPSYVEKEFHGGEVLYEPAYPNILFAVDGEVYDFNGKKCIAIGGAYSVDKPYRLSHGWNWWLDEQPDDAVKSKVEAALTAMDWKIDAVLSHTCPRKYEPVETFMSGIDQSKVDKSTEDWLDTIEAKLDYEAWYCGHYHIAKSVDRVRLMFEDFYRLVS